jgi:hypothetical protein
MPEARSKHCLRLLQAELSAAARMENGPAQDLHRTHGKMAIEDTLRKIEALLASTDLREVDTTVGHLLMTTGHHHLRHQENDDLTGVMELTGATVIFLSRRATGDILCRTCLGTAAIEVTDVGHLQQAMSTSRATRTVHGDRASLMTDNDVALEILETREKAMQMIDRIGVETIETDQATRGILVGTGGMVGHGLGVQSVGIGTATTETMTSIEDDSIHVLHARIWTMHR